MLDVGLLLYDPDKALGVTVLCLDLIHATFTRALIRTNLDFLFRLASSFFLSLTDA